MIQLARRRRQAPPRAEEAVEGLLEELPLLPQRGRRVDLGRCQQHGALADLSHGVGRVRAAAAVLVVVAVLRLRAPHLVERLESEVVGQQRAGRGGKEAPCKKERKYVSARLSRCGRRQNYGTLRSHAWTIMMIE